MIKFSLILPVYNVEKYLPKCIESCLNQDLSKTEYEIIIVIDGASDNSLFIAQQYQNRYNCIKIVEQPNSGLSVARNTGLSHASGKYIWFIDSDDFIVSNILKAIYDFLESSCLECLWIRWNNVDSLYNIVPLYDMNIHNVSEKVYSGTDFMKYVLGIYLYAWSFIYKRDFLIENDLRFKEGMFYEDTEFAFRTLPRLKYICLYNRVCYNYVNRTDSIVHTMDKKKLGDICVNMTNAFMLSTKKQDKKLKKFYKRCFSSFLLLVMKEIAKSNDSSLRDQISNLIRNEKMNKLIPVGSNVIKVIGLIYNCFGFNVSLLVLKVMLKIKK